MKENIKTALIWALAIVILLGTVWLMAYLAGDPEAPTVDNSDQIEITSEDHIKGNPEAEFTLLEYGDYQCPACATYAPWVNKILEENPDKLNFSYRHLPLTQIHDNAVGSAKAVEASALQDAFWEYHGILYANQQQWADLDNPQDAFLAYAEFLELNLEKFVEDYNSKAVEDKVIRDLQTAVQLNLSGTPTFFLNGQQLEPARNYNDFKSKIETLINE